MSLNKVRTTPSRHKTAHKNFMGGQSWDISDPIMRLRIAASSCFFGEPTYYGSARRTKAHVDIYRARTYISNANLMYLRDILVSLSPKEWEGLSPSDTIEHAIDAALDKDIALTLMEAERLRNEDNIRTTPQVILVRAANHPNAKGTGLIRKFGPKIAIRADEPAVGLAYQFATYGKDSPVPNGLKKAWAASLEGFNDYQLAKYRMESREVKTVDVVNLSHPKNSTSVKKLIKGELKTTDATWENIISKEGSYKESWQKALKVMGHMALLRNLRNLNDAGIPGNEFLNKLVMGAGKGRQLPFRYYSAYKAVQKNATPQMLDAIEECMLLSLNNLPHFEGKTMSLCDNSGSAQGNTTSSMGTMQISSIANLTGIIGGMISDEGYLGVFGDKLFVTPVRKKSSIFDHLKEADRSANKVGIGTENGIWLFWDKAIKEKQHWDNVFVFSDMQAGHGGLYGLNPNSYKNYQWNGSKMIDVPKLVNEYRAKVNLNVNVFLVQVAGYQDTIMPEYYNRTYILGGWGDGLFRFAHRMANLAQSNQNQQ